MNQKCLILFILFANATSAYTQKTNSRPIDTLVVRVDNHSIHLYRMGFGKHTVIMEAGLGANHKCWQAVDTAITDKATVITYDRPGYLDSDSCSRSRDAITVASELHVALQQASLPAPYILVGWSLGGSFIRVFAGLYPKDVIGMVLVDPAPEDSYLRFQNEHPELTYEDSLYVKEVLSSKRIGEKHEVIAFDSSMNQARRSDHNYTMPVLLLIATHGKAPGKYVNDPGNPINRIWKEELIKWAKKNKNIEYKIVESGHHIAKERPDTVVKAIRELIDKTNDSKQ